MKKYMLIGSIALLTTAGVTAAVLGSNNKKIGKKEPVKKECSSKKHCNSSKTACF